MRYLAVVILTALLALAQPVEAAVVASDDDSGDMPYASTSTSKEDPRRSPRIEVKAWPQEPVEIDVDMECSRGSHERGRERDIPMSRPPVSRRVDLSMKRPDYCYLSASAEYEDYQVEGRILLKIFW